METNKMSKYKQSYESYDILIAKEQRELNELLILHRAGYRPPHINDGEDVPEEPEFDTDKEQLFYEKLIELGVNHEDAEDIVLDEMELFKKIRDYS